MGNKLRRVREQLSSQIFSTGFGSRRSSRRFFSAQFGAPGPINQSEPNVDPQNQTAASLNSLHNTSRVLTGMITDVTAIAHVYRVQFEKAKQPVVAVSGTSSTCAISGPKDMHTFQPGTLVVCVWNDMQPYAVILAAIPTPGRSARRQMTTPLLGTTRQRVDNAHKQPLRTHRQGHIPDFLSGRPMDATMQGEQGWITETGVRIWLDSFMAQLGVDEMTAVTAFYHDQLLRITGYNLQIRSAAREEESLNDQYECRDWRGYAMYPWEQLGRVSDTDASRLRSPRAWQVDEPWYSKVEMQDDWAMPFHRNQEHGGYMGQGGKRISHGLPFPASGGGTSFVGGQGTSEPKFTGHFDHFVTADGRACFAAVKGISIVKRGGIVIPSRRRPPEDPLNGPGDDESNYKFSSKEGSGPAHKITGDIQTNGDVPFNRALGISDMHAYFFNYAGLHPFFYHARDYKTYEESELDYVGGQSEMVPPYGQLAGAMFIDSEQFKTQWEVDHRYGSQDFYKTSCGIHFLDDGGVVLFDGYGGEIRMTGGSVFISAPGDVWTKAGRNCNSWAGWDNVIRAKNSADITATEHDVRIKAEKNLQMLGGNDTIGGVLIESRSPQIYKFDELGEKVESGGVMLRAPKASVVAWAKNVYLRTGGPGIEDGVLMLDAGKGEKGIVCYGKVLQNYLGDGVYWHFGTQDENVEGPSAWITKTNAGVPGSMCINDDIIVDGAGIFGGAVLSTQAFLAVENPFVGPLEGDALAAVEGAIAQCKDLIENQIPKNVGGQYMQSEVKPTFYDDQKPGNDDVIEKAEVSLRLLEDYRTEDFKMYEDRWQQLGRLTGNAFMTWEEKPVLSQGQETFPYPGKENFQSDKLYEQSLEIFDAAAGRAKDRGGQPNLSGPYQAPKFGEPTPTSLNQYKVIR